MDFFFNTLRKGLVATIFLIFAFSATYIPQLPTSDVHEAEAGGLTGGALEITQNLNRVILGSNLVQNTMTAAATTWNWTKENVLDGIGWAIAKRIVSGIIQSLIDWVNSGFAGKPAFLQDMKGFLLNIADEVAGEFISDIMIGDFSLGFLCSPFRLDVGIAIETRYAQGRSTGSSAPSCTLSGIIDNIEGFIGGFDSGNGLSDWITITSSPQTYTPYGNVLEAEANLRARIINSQGEEVSLLGFADGFLSKKQCQTVTGADGRTSEANCQVVLPGKVISEQVNKALGAGQDSLIEADEINELIAALIGQLANTAMSGVAGLLGLSGGDAFGGYSASDDILEQAVDQSGDLLGDEAGTFNPIAESLDAERELISEIDLRRPAFETYLLTAPTGPDRNRAQAVVDEMNEEEIRATAAITSLETQSAAYDAATEDQRVEITVNFYSQPYSTETTITRTISDWIDTASDLNIDF